MKISRGEAAVIATALSIASAKLQYQAEKMAPPMSCTMALGLQQSASRMRDIELWIRHKLRDDQ